MELSKNASIVLEKRYLLRDESGKLIETPIGLFQRVAKALAKNEEEQKEFFRIMSSLEFLPNSPTLMNAGTDLGQLSACFVLPVEDSLDSIFTTLKNMAIIQQSGGGTGFSFSRLRPKGDVVKTTHGIASGPVSFMKVYNTATEVIKQGGKRRGANMGVLSVHHPDILEFVTSKEKGEELSNFNISIAATDRFMQAVEEGEKYELVNPRTDKVVDYLKARRVFDLIAEMAWKTGDPGMIFIDEVNRRHPAKRLGKIEATNPCVAGDTFVVTDEGLKRISEVHNPQWVLGKDGKFHPISWVGSTGEKEIYVVKTKAGYEVKATADHKFLTQEGKWKMVKELNKRDKLVILPGENRGKLILNKKMAEMLGWLTGDGCVTKDYKDVIFYFNDIDKKEVLPSFKRYLDGLNGKEVKVIKKGSELVLKYSARLARLFKFFGVTPSEAESKVVPEKVFELEEESLAHFLAALFSADGSVQGNRKKGVSIRLASSSLLLLKQVQLLLLQFGIFSRIYENRRKAQWKSMPDSKRKLRKYFCRAQHELIISRESMFRFMNRIGFCLSAKNEKFRRLKPKKVYRDNLDFSVEEIKMIGKAKVYDLQEPVTHSFVANGIVVHNCGEIPLLPYESCNLGSINLVKMLKGREIDWKKLEKTIEVAVRILNRVIDKNRYPIPEVEKATKRTRKIGLGVMGFAEMLIKMGVRYDTEEALRIGEELMKFVYERARKFGKKNTTVTAIAPTGSISLIADCSSGIEPLFAEEFVKEVLGGVRLKHKLETKQKDAVVTALEIAPEWHVRMQAAFQKYVDNAVSKTVNLPEKATVDDVKKVYQLAYKLKCKGVTIYRYGSKPEQVLYVEDSGCLECKI